MAGTCKDKACTAYRIFDTVIGWCGMVMAQGKILRIFVGYTKPNLLMKRIIEEFGREVCLSPGGTMAIEAIRRYCAGERVDLAGLPMDWSALTAFQQ